VVALITWSSVTSFIFLKIIDLVCGIRVPLIEEIIGADVVEHMVGSVTYNKKTKTIHNKPADHMVVMADKVLREYSASYRSVAALHRRTMSTTLGRHPALDERERPSTTDVTTNESRPIKTSSRARSIINRMKRIRRRNSLNRSKNDNSSVNVENENTSNSLGDVPSATYTISHGAVPNGHSPAMTDNTTGQANVGFLECEKGRCYSRADHQCSKLYTITEDSDTLMHTFGTRSERYYSGRPNNKTEMTYI
jgi:hypothetical protein